MRMSGDNPKDLAKAMSFDRDSNYEFIRQLIVEGFFDLPVASSGVVRRVREKFGRKLRTSYVQTYMRKFMEAGVIQAVTFEDSKGNYYVLASVTRQEALANIGKQKRVLEVERHLFSEELTKKLQKCFAVEVDELRDNFGRHGNATAFLLRKILEKLLIIVFGKLGKDGQIVDPGRPGGWKGLQDIIGIAAKEKVAGLPVLSPRTANAVKGIKFLGDSAAHNPLVSVHMNTILPQMPFIITAYEELARHL